jgi:hypothetical protein
MATMEVKSYSILFYGSPEGYQGNRAQIQLNGEGGKTLAWVRFCDPGETIKADSESGGTIRMHLPGAMFHNVLDVLRNEKPVYIRFVQNRGFLSTGKEQVGEGE